MEGLEEQFFRHGYAKLVSLLTCRFGAQHLRDIEDAVQSALLKALDVWVVSEIPDRPMAWLYRVAHNELVVTWRKQSNRQRILGENEALTPGAPERDLEHLASGDVEDELLRMVFVCCDPGIREEAQLVLALKVLCGFSVREISMRLFISEASVYKRLSRARHRLRDQPPQMAVFTLDQYAERLPAVLRIVYLLFTEGYLSSHESMAIREELCEEAIRLGLFVADHAAGAVPETFALVALMYFQIARLPARQELAGGLLLLQEQDRSLWNRSCIQEGMRWLAKSSQGASFSRYHAEAGIAAEHCMAPSYAETRWDRVVACYELLESISPSALHRLNRAIAIAEWRGPEHGLQVLEGFKPPAWLEGSYMWAAVQADLLMRSGNLIEARRYRDIALATTPTEELRHLLKRRLRDLFVLYKPDSENS